MAEARAERRLAAVLAADVAGYSRLMGQDEEGTLAALKTIRTSIVDPQIAEKRTTDPDIRVELLIIAQKWITMANGRVAVTELSDKIPLAPK